MFMLKFNQSRKIKERNDCFMEIERKYLVRTLPDPLDSYPSHNCTSEKIPLICS